MPIERWTGVSQIVASYASPHLTYDDLCMMLEALYSKYLYDPDRLFLHLDGYLPFEAMLPEWIRRFMLRPNDNHLYSLINPTSGHSIVLAYRSDIRPGEMLLSCTDVGAGIPWPKEWGAGLAPLAMDVGRLLQLEQEA